MQDLTLPRKTQERDLSSVRVGNPNGTQRVGLAKFTTFLLARVINKSLSGKNRLPFLDFIHSSSHHSIMQRNVDGEEEEAAAAPDDGRIAFRPASSLVKPGLLKAFRLAHEQVS